MMDAEECSLYHVREVKQSIAERSSLEPYVTLLQDLHASLVVLTIAFPHVVCKHVKHFLDTPFLQELQIASDSLRFNILPNSIRHSGLNHLFQRKKRKEEVNNICHKMSQIHFYNLHRSSIQ